jgi:hypothetical protein
MKRAQLSTIVLGSTLVSLAMAAHPTELAARDKSSGGASVSAGGASVSAGRGGASVSAGGVSVSAGRGGASVSADRGGASVDVDGRSVSATRGDRNIDDSHRKAPAVQARQSRRPSGDRSYDNLGEWFADLRAWWSGGRTKGTEGGTTTHSSATEKREFSDSTGTQVNRVTQKKSSIATATDGGSAVAEASNVNVTEQKK